MDVSVVMRGYNHKPINKKTLPAGVMSHTHCLSLTIYTRDVKQKADVSLMRQKLQTLSGKRRGRGRGGGRDFKKAKNKDVFSRLSHCWTKLEGNDHS